MNYFPLSILISIIWFFFKLSYSGIRFSDTNLYFYTAQQILAGKMLYKDVFFTNLPAFPYLSTIYAIFNSLEFYYISSLVEVFVSSIVVYLCVKHITNNSFYALLSNVFYLFSFIILTTSDHQTGVFLASLFSLLAYYCYLKKHKLLTGILLGIMFCIKAYYIPIVISFLLYDLVISKEQSKKVFFGMIFSTLIVVTPFLLLSYEGFYKGIIQYSLQRSAGLDKSSIVLFFISHDLLLFISFIVSILNVSKNILFGLISIFTSIFFIFYKDIYYLYLNIFVPFLIINIIVFIHYLEPNLKDYKKNIFLLGGLILLVINIFKYFNNYALLQRITTVDQIVKDAKKLHTNKIYGIEEVVTAIAQKGNFKMINNLVDTNENLFLSKILDAKKLTLDAIKQDAVVVLKGVDYPQKNLFDPTVTNIIDKAIFNAKCKLVNKYPVNSEGIINIITLFYCSSKNK